MSAQLERRPAATPWRSRGNWRISDSVSAGIRCNDQRHTFVYRSRLRMWLYITAFMDERVCSTASDA